jgi:phosphoribosylamine--glycine ligase
VVLELMETDLLSIMQAVEAERLSEVDVVLRPGAACCVVIASGGYPEQYKKGYEISLSKASKFAGVTLYHAGTAMRDGKLLTSGGRVIGVTARAPNLKDAIEKAYGAAREVKFEGAYYRSDIGKTALNLIDR